MLAARTTGGVISIDVSGGGANYTSGVTISFTGGGGTGAAAMANMAGNAIENIIVTNSGTGYTAPPTVQVNAATGSGATAVANIYTGSLRPISFFQGRSGEVYGVDGMGRGIRWDGQAATAYPIGLARPVSAPTVTATSTSSGQYVSSIQMVRQGAGYNAVPSVALTGGTPSTTASARALMSDGRITNVSVLSGGRDYKSAPAVSFSGGFPSGEAFTPSVLGAVESVEVVSGGTGYSVQPGQYPSIVFSTAQGLTSANAGVSVNNDGTIGEVFLYSSGTGATTSGVTANITATKGSGAVLKVNMAYRIAAVTVTNGGTGHQTPPVISFTPDATDLSGYGAAATASVSNGSVTAVNVYAGGRYALPPTVSVLDTGAEAVAVLSKPIVGKYLCAVRYLDDTPASGGGPLPSSISNLAEIDSPSGVGAVQWSFTHGNVDDRVKAMELWRTTADQAVVLYRVATIQRSDTEWSGGYTDTLTDADLLDTTRSTYGLMPITLPSGQINARRFEVPPGNYAVAVMFQDRAWYAVDTTGKRPNSLLFSEVDEPESVPYGNELIIQESAGEYDSVVALIPLGAQLLIAQTGHLYALNYVAQPVLDASISLVAYRGALSSSCWTVLGGVAFLVDSYGMYAYDGNGESSLSEPIEDYWRDNIIDFSKRSLFHVAADHNAKVVRFYYCRSSDSSTVRALCYCVATKAWWEEEYAEAVTAACEGLIGGKRVVIAGTSNGNFQTPRLGADASGAAVGWSIRSGNMALDPQSPDRSIGVLYTPTTSDNNLSLRLHFNNTSTPRQNAIATDRGSGFITNTGDTSATLNMKSTRSSIGIATGYARAMFAGRLDPNSSGGDRHVAVAMAGTQGSEPVRIHAVTVAGVS